MRMSSTVGALSIIGLLAVTVRAQEDITGLLLKADQLLKRNRGQQAVEAYKQANDSAGGKCAECLAGLAAAFNQLGASKPAAEAAQKLLDLGASKDMTLRGYKELGIAHMKKGDDKALAAAEQAFKQALEVSEGGWNEGRYALGIVLMRQKRDDEGLATLKEFLEKDPNSPNAAHAKQMIERPACGREECVPIFSIVTADGDYINQDNLKGKVTLLHFWLVTDDWVDEMWPGMKRLAMWSKKGDSPVQVLGITGERDEGRARRFMAERGMSWPQSVDRKNGNAAAAFRVNWYPSQIVVNHEGIIVYRSVNWSDARADEVNQAISMAVHALKKAQKSEPRAKEESKKD